MQLKSSLLWAAFFIEGDKFNIRVNEIGIN
jgi:hypothetical protein